MHPVNFFFLTPQSHFSWVSESFSQDIGRILTWKVFFMKIYLFMKTLTDFRKTVETGVDPRLGIVSIWFRQQVQQLHGYCNDLS